VAHNKASPRGGLSLRETDKLSIHHDLLGRWLAGSKVMAESLAHNGFDARDQMGRYLDWWKWGILSSTGTCFDIGMTVRSAWRDSKSRVSRTRVHWTRRLQGMGR
jgi:hypothetical protein